jgi:cyclophilin family peptidyl-prolyl cis-trans isomerase
MIRSIRLFALVALLPFVIAGGPVSAADLDNTLYLDVPAGRVVIELRPDLAPQTVAHIKELTKKGFYDGLKFHRVIPGFMAQTGDPQGNGAGGSGQTVKAEFTQTHFLRGSLGLARTDDPNSGDSQFFICFQPSAFLDGKYTLFGQVSKGMEFVDAIKKGDAQRNGTVTNPDRIVKMQMAADEKKP